MSSTHTYKSIFLEPDWAHQKYYGWEVIVSGDGICVLLKKYAFIKRYLVLSQLDSVQLRQELLKLKIFGFFSIVTIKDFLNPPQDNGAEILVEGLRIPKTNDTEQLLNRYTFVVDLTQEPEKLWSNMNSHTKRLCHKSSVSGVVVECVASPSDELLSLFFERYAKMANERSLAIPDAKLIGKMFNEGRLTMYYVRNESEVCSIVLVYSAGLKSIFLYGVAGKQKNDGSGQFLHWKIIEHLKLSGQHWYDLGGIPKVDDSNGIYRFKKGFGGEVFDLGCEYFYCHSALLFAKRMYKKFRLAF
ncbi:peptidoglycan bridge formation glycyltransferase FemA/FemB family protein [Crenothrix sp.]|uniref:peptidoglycan bridge formation glycyltransferase FemA/FemB family protein n=1 Tax=Crenothrix sp. TaxID=3100433 RepID=UPI00374D36E2